MGRQTSLTTVTIIIEANEMGLYSGRDWAKKQCVWEGGQWMEKY